MRLISEKSLAERIVDVILSIKKERWASQERKISDDFVFEYLLTTNHKGVDFFLDASNCLHKKDCHDLWVRVGIYAFKIDILSEQYAQKLTSHYHSIETYLSSFQESKMGFMEVLGIINVGDGEYVFK